MRRAAIVVTAVVLPVVVVLIVLAKVLGGGADPSGSPAELSGAATPPQRADLPVLAVDVPPVTPAADAACPALMKVLPLDLVDEASRRVDSDSPFAYAWGDPPVVLVCGVDRPAGWVVGESAIQINGVQWYVDTDDPDTTVWTAVDRSVYVEVRVPSTIDSGPVTALTTHIAEALPYQEPRPGP
ncbi:MAG: uncharacterized protein JWQ45_2633 [Blastococcus sp.]|jgi:hypothetical protein|nr:uncharacterized protein [Blastococcus sp.]